MNTEINIGIDQNNNKFSYDIKYMPHLLIAGNTGSGKSQLLHSLIMQLIGQNTPDEIKFIMLDCNRVELMQYQNIPYLYAPVQTESNVGKDLFEWLNYEQNLRHEEFNSHKVRGIGELNSKFGKIVMPRIVVIIDELATIMNIEPKAVEKEIIGAAQLSKYSGIHIILCTQVISKNVITGLIKENIPSRIGLRTTTREDSEYIIDQPCAEKLKGKGDMLFIPPDTMKAAHLQGIYFSEKEIFKCVEKIKVEKPQYNEVLMYALRKKEVTIPKELLEKAKNTIAREKKASTSLIQHELSIGYLEATRILDKLKEEVELSSSKR